MGRARQPCTISTGPCAWPLAQRCSLPLRLVLPLVLPLVSNPEFESVAPELAARAAQTAARHIAELRDAAHAAGVQLDPRVRSGAEPWAEIVAEAREYPADLLITRRRGKRGLLARLLVGEMVSQVVANAPCSVLMVPEQGGMWRGGVLAAIDDASLGPQVAATAAAVAARCGAPLLLVHVIPASATPEQRQRGQAVLDQACQAASQAGLNPSQAELLHGALTPEEQIITRAQADGADLLVVGRSSQLPSTAQARLGSTARRIIARAMRSAPWSNSVCSVASSRRENGCGCRCVGNGMTAAFSVRASVCSMRPPAAPPLRPGTAARTGAGRRARRAAAPAAGTPPTSRPAARCRSG
jgi:hypothetical protein